MNWQIKFQNIVIDKSAALSQELANMDRNSHKIKSTQHINSHTDALELIPTNY